MDAGSRLGTLGIGAAIRRAAEGRRCDGEHLERVLFALVAQRALDPGCKFAASGWVAERVAIEGLSGFSEDQAYRAMDFLLDALTEIAAEVFAQVAHLLNLDLDIVFVDTTSTYFQTETADDLADLQDEARDDEVSNPVEAGMRTFGHSQDHRTDLPQVVIAMAVTRDGVPVRCWTFPDRAGHQPGTPAGPIAEGGEGDDEPRRAEHAGRLPQPGGGVGRLPAERAARPR